jgi:hypothetical protein
MGCLITYRGQRFNSVQELNAVLEAEMRYGREYFSFMGRRYQGVGNVGSLGEGEQSWKNYSQMINSATDNAKLLELHKVNLNKDTAAMANFMVAYGVPLADVLRFIKDPQVNLAAAAYQLDTIGTDKEGPEIAYIIKTYQLSPATFHLATQFSDMAGILGINQGLPSTPEEMYVYFQKVRRAGGEQLIEYINLDPEGRAEMEKEQGNSVLNAINVLKHNPHYITMMKAAYDLSQKWDRESPQVYLANRVTDMDPKFVKYDEAWHAHVQLIGNQILVDNYLKTESFDDRDKSFNLAEIKDRKELLAYFPEYINYLRQTYGDSPAAPFVNMLKPNQRILNGNDNERTALYTVVGLRTAEPDTLTMLRFAFENLLPADQKNLRLYDLLVNNGSSPASFSILIPHEIKKPFNQSIKSFDPTTVNIGGLSEYADIYFLNDYKYHDPYGRRQRPEKYYTEEEWDEGAIHYTSPYSSMSEATIKAHSKLGIPFTVINGQVITEENRSRNRGKANPAVAVAAVYTSDLSAVDPVLRETTTDQLGNTLTFKSKFEGKPRAANYRSSPVKLSIDKKGKDQGKADYAHAFIGYGTKRKSGPSSTATYAKDFKDQGAPVNEEIVPYKGMVVFASVSSEGTNNQETMFEIRRVLDGGATVIMDNTKDAFEGEWNKKGEAKVQESLGTPTGRTQEGFNFWSNDRTFPPMPQKVGKGSTPTLVTTSKKLAELTPSTPGTGQWFLDRLGFAYVVETAVESTYTVGNTIIPSYDLTNSKKEPVKFITRENAEIYKTVLKNVQDKSLYIMGQNTEYLGFQDITKIKENISSQLLLDEDAVWEAYPKPEERNAVLGKFYGHYKGSNLAVKSKRSHQDPMSYAVAAQDVDNGFLTSAQHFNQSSPTLTPAILNGLFDNAVKIKLENIVISNQAYIDRVDMKANPKKPDFFYNPNTTEWTLNSDRFNLSTPIAAMSPVWMRELMGTNPKLYRALTEHPMIVEMAENIKKTRKINKAPALEKAVGEMFSNRYYYSKAVKRDTVFVGNLNEYLNEVGAMTGINPLHTIGTAAYVLNERMPDGSRKLGLTPDQSSMLSQVYFSDAKKATSILEEMRKKDIVKDCG